jgi:anti-sigma B factor antagonist
VASASFNEESLDEAVRLIAISGDLDISNSRDLRTRVARALSEGVLTLVIDLSDVMHIDSSALAALIEAHQRTSERRGKLLLVVNSMSVRRTIEVRGLDGVLAIVESREAAIGSLGTPQED